MGAGPADFADQLLGRGHEQREDPHADCGHFAGRNLACLRAEPVTQHCSNVSELHERPRTADKAPARDLVGRGFERTDMQIGDIAQIDDAEKSITGKQTEPRGLLRISAPSTYAHYRLLPRLADFKSRYPLIELDINIANRNIDFVEDGYDVAIRLGTPPDSRLIARKLEDAPVGVYATPAYVKRHGTPTGLPDLKDKKAHTLLPFVLPSTGKALPWIFMQAGQQIELLPNSTVRVSEDPLGCVVLARASMGLVQTFGWIASSYGKEFVEILKPLSGCSRPFYLLYPQNRHQSAKVRALVDFLTPIKSAKPSKKG